MSEDIVGHQLFFSFQVEHLTEVSQGSWYNFPAVLKIDFDSLESIFDCDEINRLDGIKFSWSDKWIHIRKSNTEPIIRIFAEAPTKDEVDELVNTLKNYVK